MADLNTAYNTLLESQQSELEELKEFYKQKCEEYNELKRAYVFILYIIFIFIK